MRKIYEADYDENGMLIWVWRDAIGGLEFDTIKGCDKVSDGLGE